MTQLAKFSVKAISIYGCAQIADGIPVVNDTPTGTITTTVGSTAVVGVGTQFLTQAAQNSYIYDTSNNVIGQIKTVTDNTHIVLVSAVPATATAYAVQVTPIATAVTGVPFKLGMGAKNVLPVLNLNYSEEVQTEAFQWTGNELSRDEVTIVKDTFGKLDFETYLQCRGVIAGTDPVPTEFPMAAWYEASGMAVVFSTGGLGAIELTNSLPSNNYMTIEVRRSSPDLTPLDENKVYTMVNCRGLFDADVSISSKVKFKFTFQGDIINIAEKPIINPDFGLQKQNLSATLRSDVITLSELDPYVNGIAPALSLVTNFCFDKCLAPNFSGFDYTRYQTSCEGGWSKEATPTDVTLSILEDSANAVYQPFNELTVDHQLDLRFGLGAGNKVEILWDRLKLASITNGTIASYVSQELKFRNTDNVTITLS